MKVENSNLGKLVEIDLDPERFCFDENNNKIELKDFTIEIPVRTRYNYVILGIPKNESTHQLCLEFVAYMEFSTGRNKDPKKNIPIVLNTITLDYPIKYEPALRSEFGKYSMT